MTGSVTDSAARRPRFRGLTWEGLGSCLGVKSVDGLVVIQERVRPPRSKLRVSFDVAI